MDDPESYYSEIMRLMKRLAPDGHDITSVKVSFTECGQTREYELPTREELKRARRLNMK